MTKHQRLATALVLSGSSLLTITAFAQQPPASSTDNSASKKAATAPAKNSAARRSIVHHYRYPYPGHYNNDETAGFRNPGGVGRYAEYYPAGNHFGDGSRDPVHVAHFDQGGGAPDRAEQLQAQQIGIQRQNSIQNHIDNYARPYMGYGVGFFGGFY